MTLRNLFRRAAATAPILLGGAALLLAAGCGNRVILETGDSGPTIQDFEDPQADDVTYVLHDSIETLVYVNWTQTEPATVWVEYSFDTDEWLSTPTLEIATADDVSLLLLGIPYQTEFSYRVVNDFGSGAVTGEQYEGETGGWPDGLPEPTLVSSDDTQYDPSGKYLMGSVNEKSCGWCSGVYWKYFIDRKGRVVWADKTGGGDWTVFMRVDVAGDAILYDQATWWSDWDMGAASKIHKIKIDGTVVETVSAPGLHHAFTQLPDGRLVWGAATSWSSEELYVQDGAGGVDSLWNCDQWKDEADERWNDCQSNTLFYDTSSNSFYYSFYSLDTIVQVDGTTGASLRWFGDIDNAWTFSPPNSQFWWMHGVNILENGNLLTSTHCEEWSSQCCAREYEFNDATEKLEQVWSFGDGAGSDTVNADTAGEAHRLANGNTLHNYGSGSRMREVTNGGEVVWDLKFNSGQLIGRTVFVEDLYAFAP
jgi:hypothetical protein